MFRDKTTIVVILLATSSVARAEQQLSWNACVREASKGNAELRAAVENLQSAKSSSKAAYAGFMPRLSGKLGYDRGGGEAVKEEKTDTGVSTAYSAGLSVSQNLFSGFSDQAKVNQGSANMRAAAAALDGTKAKVAADLKNAFAGLLYAQESSKLALDISRRREENLRLVELRFESGRENKGSVLLSSAYLKQGKYESLLAKNRIRVAQAQLGQVLGRDEFSSLSVGADVPQRSPIEEDLKAILLKTPDHREALAKEESADAGITANRAAFYPNLELSGGLTRKDDEWFPKNKRWAVGLTLTVPLFDGGRDFHLTKSAIANHDAAVDSRVQTDRQTLTSLEATHAAFVESIEKLIVDESFLLAAKTRAEIARNKYNNGLLNFEEWDLVENDLINRQKSVLQSRRDRVNAEAGFEKTAGKGL